MVDFLQSYWWSFVLGASILIVSSFFYYKAEVEKKGKKFLRIPFFVIIGLYSILFVFGVVTNDPAEMGALGLIYMLVAFPFVCGGLMLLVPLLRVLFRVCRITSLKRLGTFSLILFILSLLPIFLFFSLYSFSAEGIEDRAVANGDPLLCNKIDAKSLSRSEHGAYRYLYEKGTSYAQEFCKMNVVQKKNHFEICETLSYSDLKNECVSLAAVRTGNQKWCDILETREKSACHQSLGLALSLKEKYCPQKESYVSCMKNICSDLFSSVRIYSKIDDQLNQCQRILQNK